VGLEEKSDTSEPFLSLNKSNDNPKSEVASENLSSIELVAPEPNDPAAPSTDEMPVGPLSNEPLLEIAEPQEEDLPDLVLGTSDDVIDAQDLDPEWFSVGFEDFDSDAGVYSTFDASLALSDDEVWSGETSLKVTQGGEWSEARFIHKIPRVKDDELFFRAWVYVPPAATTGKMKLVGFRSRRFDGIDLNLNSNMKFDVFHHDTFERNWSTEVFEEGRWSCLQVALLADRYQGSYQVFLDEELILEVEDTDTQPGPIDFVEFGLLWNEDGQEGGIVYWDEVAASDSFIPCEYDD
jgi:hypothetical protein